jgi:hypothetical protein
MKIMADKYYTEIVSSVGKSFDRRKKEQEEVWKGFTDEKENLESYLNGMFADLIHRVKLQTTTHYPEERNMPIQVYDWKTSYNPETTRARIEILEWGVIGGEDVEYGGIPEGRCAYMALGKLVGLGDEKDPLVKQFEETYNASIFTNCRCGSDHK